MSLIVSLFITILILRYFTHKYPIKSDDEEIKASYFNIYTDNHEQTYLKAKFIYELNYGKSVVNDYLILNWLIENNLCILPDNYNRKLLSYDRQLESLKIKDPTYYTFYMDELEYLPLLKKCLIQYYENCK